MSNVELNTGMFALLVAIALLFFIYYSIVKMARDRGRSAVAWVLLSFFISPLFTLIILAIVGDSRKKQHQELMDKLDEINRRQ